MSMKKYNFCTTQFRTATSTAPNCQIFKWKLHIYPNGDKEGSKNHISFYFCLIDPNNEEVEAKFQFTIRKPDGNEFILASYNKCKFTNSGSGLGDDKLIKREKLLDEKNGFLVGDQLTIECTVIVQQESVEKASSSDVEIPECRVVEDLSEMFEKSLFWDCKIISEDKKEFKVHKCILGCRSPVFGAMFEHEMIEKNNNEAKIEDMKRDVIEQMLRFIYSGKEPDMDSGMAEDLLEAADKYELTRLKLLCERKLINSLDNANACALLALANLHSAGNLKTQAIGFIKMHLKEVMKSEGWTHADHQLKDQIFEAITEK